MLRTTDKPTSNKPQSTQAKNQYAPGADSTGGVGSADRAGGGNKNLLSTGKLKNRTRPFRNGFLYSRIQQRASNWWSPNSADYQKRLSRSGNPRNFKFLRNWSMTLEDLFFFLQENNSYQDTIWDSQLGACSYCWNLWDLTLLLRKLQVWSPRIQ